MGATRATWSAFEGGLQSATTKQSFANAVSAEKCQYPKDVTIQDAPSSEEQRQPNNRHADCASFINGDAKRSAVVENECR